MKTTIRSKRKSLRYLPSYYVLIGNNKHMEVRPTANAWWKREHKVHLLIRDLKDGYKIPKACKRAGISMAQYKYFARVHPEIKEIRKTLKNDISRNAGKTMAERAKSDPKFALRLRSKTNPEEFPPPPLLKRVSSLEAQIEQEREEHRDEIRGLKNIIETYREATQ